MKKLIIVMFAAAMLLGACKSKEMAIVEEEPVAEVITPDPQPEPEPEPAEILVVEERFTFDKKEDKESHDQNSYFVILGSFSYKDNAERFIEMLKAQGFSPMILLSEVGFHRVSVNSYDNETDARVRIERIRNAYPEYHDLWLLIRQD